MCDRFESAAHQITGDGVTHGLRHDEAEASGCFGGTKNRVDDAKCTSHAATRSHCAPVIVSPSNPILPRRHDREESGLGRKLRAALAATSRKDCATGTGAHAGAETVNFGATAIIGLEGTLAHRKTP